MIGTTCKCLESGQSEKNREHGSYLRDGHSRVAQLAAVHQAVPLADLMCAAVVLEVGTAAFKLMMMVE